MALTDMQIRSARPKIKDYKLWDERGLFLVVKTNGTKLWRFKYRIDGIDRLGKYKKIEKALSFGMYPDVSLQRARILRDEAREMCAAGLDPAIEKQRAKAAARASAENSFANVAQMLLEKQEREGRAPATLEKRRWFIQLVYPVIGKMPVNAIQPMDILMALRPIERRGNHETASRALGFIGQVFRYAVACQLVETNPARDLRGALTVPKTKHHAAILDPGEVGALMRAIHGYSGHDLTRWALIMSAHTFVRPGELRQAEWEEFNLEKAIWRIPAWKMKARSEHVVPLSRQVLEVLGEIDAWRVKRQYVFPSLRGPYNCMSENAVTAALRRMGYSGEEMTAHGFRSTASTLLNESGLWQPEARSFAFLKRFTVFNVAQVDGLPEALGAAPAWPGPEEISSAAQTVIEQCGADIRIGGDRAYYAPGPDYLRVPEPSAFRREIDWYRTLFHELGHWTGHQSRLAREQRGTFGGPDYAREELVAEMASAFTCAALRIEPKARHSDYIGAWLDVLRGDERAIFRAASQRLGR